MEIPKKRLTYIDAMRGFTMILVVYSHVQYFGYGEFTASVVPTMESCNTLIYRDLFVLFLCLYFSS